MAIQFTQKTSEQGRRTLYLTIILFIMVVIAVFFWNSRRGTSFFPDVEEDTVKIQEQRTSIDLEKLEHEMLKALTPFENIVPPEEISEKIGRDNPFTPAPTSTVSDDNEEEEAEEGGEALWWGDLF